MPVSTTKVVKNISELLIDAMQRNLTDVAETYADTLRLIVLLSRKIEELSDQVKYLEEEVNLK